MDSNQKLKFIEIRRAICNTCEHQKSIIGAKYCDKCGCSVWGKTMMQKQACPLGKWDAEKN
jgi:hypothetical protein